MKGIPASKKQEVLSWVFRGLSTRQVGDEVGVSHTTVSGVVKEFSVKVKEVGLMAAASSYGVGSQISELIEIGQLKEDMHLSLSEAKEGYLVSNALKGTVPVGEVREFAEGLVKEAGLQSLAPKAVVDLSKKMLGLKVQTDQDYFNLVRVVEDLKTEQGKQEKQASALREEIASLNRTRAETLALNHLTETDVKWYRDTSDRLGQRELDIHDLNKVEPLLANIEELGGEEKKILEFYTRSMDLAKREEDLQTQVTDSERKLVNVQEELEEKSRLLAEKAGMEAAVRRLEARGLSPSHVDAVAEKIISVSAMHGLEAKDAVGKIVGDIETKYDEKLGFEAERNREKARRDQLAEEIAILKDDKRIIEGEYAAKENAIRSLKDINMLGVGNSEVVEWGGILVGQKEDLASFRRGMDELGGLKNYMAKKSGTVKALEEREEVLKDEIERKGSALRQLDDMFLAKNKEFVDKLVDGVEKLEKAMKTLEDNFNSPETGLKKKSEDLVAATLLNIDKVSLQVRTDSTKQMLELEKKIKEVVGTVENVKDSAFRAGEVIGRYSNLKPLLSIYIGESADAGQVKVSMVAMLDALGKWLGKQGYRQSKMDCDQLKETLKNEWLAIAG